MNKDGPDQTKEDKELPLEEMCWEVIPTEPEETQYLDQVKPWEKLFYSFVGLTDLGVAYDCIDSVINGSFSANKTLALIISSTSIGTAIVCYESFNGRNPIKAYLKKRRKKKVCAWHHRVKIQSNNHYRERREGMLPAGTQLSLKRCREF